MGMWVISSPSFVMLPRRGKRKSTLLSSKTLLEKHQLSLRIRSVVASLKFPLSWTSNSNVLALVEVF